MGITYTPSLFLYLALLAIFFNVSALLPLNINVQIRVLSFGSFTLESSYTYLEFLLHVDGILIDHISPTVELILLDSNSFSLLVFSFLQLMSWILLSPCYLNDTTIF